MEDLIESFSCINFKDYDEQIQIINTEITRDILSPIHVMCKYGYIDLLRYYINNTNKNEESKYTLDTPLHIAVKFNQKNIVNFLCINKVDINKKNSSNMTSLYYALRMDNIDIIDQLLKFGANINEALEYSVYYNLNHILYMSLQYDIEYILLENALALAYKNNYTNGIVMIMNHIEK